MRTAREIYEHYRIPPWLQLHQLRVAAIGQILSDAMRGVTDTQIILLTALFHDMGNVLKFDFSSNGLLLKLVESDKVAYWKARQDDFRHTYGTNEHEASITIGKEIGLPATILDMIDNMRFSRTEWIFEEASFEMKIAKYADLRTGPFGILSLQERLAEAGRRYRGKAFDTGEEYDAQLLARTEEACVGIEKIVCEAAGVEPATINDVSAAPIIEKLWEYEIA